MDGDKYRGNVRTYIYIVKLHCTVNFAFNYVSHIANLNGQYMGYYNFMIIRNGLIIKLLKLNY